MKKLFLTLTMLLFAFTGVMRASAEQGNVRADQVIEQGFEDGLGDWTLNHCHSSSGPTSSYGGNTGNYAFRFYYTANYPQYLISPELDDNDGVNFTFYAARYSSNYPETFMVGYSSTTNDPTEFTWGSEVTCTTMYGAGAYQEYSYDFPAGTKYVSIACTSNDQFYMFVDDITVTATEPAPAPTPGGIVEVTIGDPTSTTANAYLPGYTLYDYAISQQIYTADEIGVAGTINTLTMWLKNSSSYARNINVYMKETEASVFESTSAWESFTASDMVASFTMPNGNATPIEVALDLSTPFEYSGTGNLVICFQDVTGSWSSGLGGVEMDASGNQAIYAYRDGTVYDPSNVGVNGTLLTKKNVIKLSIMTSGGGASTAFSTIPDVLDLGYRPNGAWMAPYVFNLKSNVGAVTVNALDFSGNYFTYNAELPATVSGNNPLEVAVSTGTAEAGEVNSTITVLYGENRDAAQFEITANAYDPVDGDVWENAIEVPALEPRTPYESELPEILYKNYELPDGTENTDAVYKMVFDHDMLLYAGANSANASAFLYTEDFQQVGGPAADNNYMYDGPQVNPGPTALWFYYDYTGSNTWYGTSAGGGFYFGYKISTDVIAQNELAGLTITTVEAAAREAYPYYCFIIEGGSTPFDGDLIGMGGIENPQALYFFDINLEMPAYISGNNDIWVIFYSDSPYAAYCGRYPVDTNNGKIWTYNPNASSPMWSSNTTYAPVIYCRMLELPTGREVNMDLAKMEVKKGNGVYSEVAEAEGDVMNVAKASRSAAQTLTVHDGSATNGNVPVYGFYADAYLKCEMVYPAAELADMAGGTINGMTFYASQSSVSWGAANFQVFVTEVADASISAFAGPGTVVYEGALSIVEGEMVVNFTTPYEYNGGNLLVGVYNVVAGSYVTSTWYGETVDGASFQGYNYSNLSDVTGSQRNFLPKTTFSYEAAGGGNPEPPTPVYEPWNCPFTCQIDAMYVPAGTYYLVFASDVVRDVVNIGVDEVPAPEQAIIIAPEDGESNVVAPYLAEWILGDYTTEMQVLVGTQYPPQTALIDWTTELVESAFLTDLEPNQSYFMQVNARNAAGTTMGEIVAFTTPIDGVEGFQVAEANLYPGDAAEFSWEANRAHKGYNLYCDGVKVNETLITTNEYAVEDLAYNMQGYQFTLTAVYDAGESEPTEAITVYMTGFGTLSGHVYDLDEDHPIANATVTYIGVDEYGAACTAEFTTDENGLYTGQALAGVGEIGVTTDGYAYVVYMDENQNSQITIEYNGVYENLDIFAHEFYYPLSQITATEQTDENNVLVEWSWTPSDLTIDFETGDFSQADFTLPAQYPWAITTTNAHDGTYCMKSTCEGQASASSTIEVTVDVPYDGKMGFWVNVSSEQNYDKFHFYIDGVEQGAALSGVQPYAYKEFAVSEGTHTYKWEYAKDSSVNSNDDCAYVDDVTLYRYEAPLPPVVGATVYDFDDNTMMGWTSLDADGDGNGWVSSANPGIYHNSGVSLAGTGNNASEAYVISGSYANQTGQALTPDNYLVSPAQISAEAGAQIQFWACAQDASYAAEHFGVAVSTTTATAGAFTTIQEWTMTAKGTQGRTAEAERDIRGTRQGTWYQYAVDLSAYAGQDIWVAIRHFNCTDMFILNVDDITLATGGSKMDVRSDRSLMSYNLYRRNNVDAASVEDPELIAEGLATDVMDYIDNDWATLPFGEWQWGIQATYEGYATDEPTRDQFTYGFEGGLDGWTGIVVLADGGEWIHSNNNLGGYDYTTLAHGGSGFAMCYSYVDYDGPYNTDAYLVSPQKYSIDANSTLSFFADNANDSYPENFSVCISTAANPTSSSDFTQIWSGGAKGTSVDKAAVRHDNNRYENWRSHEISLAAYAGQEIWIAFHDVNYDMYEIWIDDVTITAGGSNPNPNPNPNPQPGPTGSGLSEIIWSNVLEKDMEATMNFNVTLNNGQSPVGAAVTVAGENNSYNATVNEEGQASIVIRKGDTYALAVELEGYASWNNNQQTVYVDQNTYNYDVQLNEIIGIAEGLYVSPTGWAKWDGVAGGTTPVNPVGPTGSDSFTEDFEGGLNGWNVLTVNADGGEWLHSSQNLGGYDYTTLAHGGTGFAICYSFVDYVGAFNTDSYLYTPQKYDIVAGSTLTFFADNANDSYPENFSVCVATADNPTTSDFTQVWSGGAKGQGGNDVVRHINNRYENWRSHSIDLSAYAGQSVYIAFHDVNYDAYEIWIDDVELSNGSKGNRAPLSFKVKLDGKYEGETTNGYFQHNTDGMAVGSVHTTEVAAVYVTGMGDWTPYTWTYAGCENFTGVTNASGEQSGTSVNLTWTMPEGVNPNPNPNPNPTGGFTEGFENGMPDGWTVIDNNNDGYSWCMTSAIPSTWTYYASLSLDWYRTGTNAICSGSYINGVGAITPDEYLVTNQVTPGAGSTFKFWAAATDASYPADHFGVAVSTTTATASAFTMLNEWTLTAKDGGVPGGRASRDGNGSKLATWREYSVDLSAYAGQNIYIAIRHFNCNDQYIMCVDDIELTGGSKGTRDAWDLVTSFEGTSAGQQAVATDGNYIYTASWQTTPTGGYTFYKYDLQGNFIEGFDIAGATGIRDLTTDGEYFYGTSGGAQIFILDFTNKTLVGTINCSGLTSRHISYDPERDGFWSGNWSTLALYSRTGALIQNGPAPTSAYGSAYYKDADNVEHLYLFCQPNSDCQVYDYNITTGTLGGVVLDFSSTTPGCTGIAGGCFIGNYADKLCWFGNSQQDPNLIGIYELEAGTNPNPNPNPVAEGVMGAYVFRNGELIAMLGPDATSYTDNGAVHGENIYWVRVVYDGEPDESLYAMSCPEDITVNFECTPVADLQGTPSWDVDHVKVDLTWTCAAHDIISYYEVYHDGTIVGTTEDLNYTVHFDSRPEILTFGVIAVYDNCSSEMVTCEVVNTVGVDEFSGNVAIYPNPTNSNVTIEAKGMSHITVVSSIGQVVYDADIEGDMTQLNLGQFQAGVYMVRVNSENGVSVRRVTVVK